MRRLVPAAGIAFSILAYFACTFNSAQRNPAPINQSQPRQTLEDLTHCPTTHSLGVSSSWTSSDIDALNAAVGDVYRQRGLNNVQVNCRVENHISFGAGEIMDSFKEREERYISGFQSQFRLDIPYTLIIPSSPTDIGSCTSEHFVANLVPTKTENIFVEIDGTLATGERFHDQDSIPPKPLESTEVRPTTHLTIRGNSITIGSIHIAPITIPLQTYQNLPAAAFEYLHFATLPTYTQRSVRRLQLGNGDLQSQFWTIALEERLIDEGIVHGCALAALQEMGALTEEHIRTVILPGQSSEHYQFVPHFYQEARRQGHYELFNAYRTGSLDLSSLPR